MSATENYRMILDNFEFLRKEILSKDKLIDYLMETFPYFRAISL